MIHCEQRLRWLLLTADGPVCRAQTGFDGVNPVFAARQQMFSFGADGSASDEAIGGDTEEDVQRG